MAFARTRIREGRNTVMPNHEVHPMPVEREALRDWYRQFGLLRTAFFAG
jgi:hypothetical protein